jgi:hypothetical protein
MAGVFQPLMRGRAIVTLYIGILLVLAGLDVLDVDAHHFCF